MLQRSKIAQRMRQVQEGTGLNGVRFAALLGTSASYVSDMKRRKTKPSLEVLARLSAECGVNLDWLLRGEGEMFREPPARAGGGVRALPVLGEVPCGAPVAQYADEPKRETMLVGALAAGREAFVLIARGESMMPRIEPGDKLVCAAAELREVRDGDIVVVSFAGAVGVNETNCKIIRFYDRASRVVLMPLNPEYAAQEFPLRDIYRIYKVRRIIRDLP